MFESMKKGVLDMYVNSPVLLGPFIPEYQIYELPNIFQSNRAICAVSYFSPKSMQKSFCEWV